MMAQVQPIPRLNGTPLSASTPKLMPAVAPHIRNLRSQEADGPAHMRPMNGSSRTVMGLIPMDAVTSRMPRRCRRVAAR